MFTYIGNETLTRTKCTVHIWLQLVIHGNSIIKQHQRELLPGFPTFSWNPIKVQYRENVLLLCCSNPM